MQGKFISISQKYFHLQKPDFVYGFMKWGYVIVFQCHDRVYVLVHVSWLLIVSSTSNFICVYASLNWAKQDYMGRCLKQTIQGIGGKPISRWNHALTKLSKHVTWFSLSHFCAETFWFPEDCLAVLKTSVLDDGFHHILGCQQYTLVYLFL